MTARAAAILTAVILALILVVLGGIALAWRDCNDHGGKLVQGVIGYQCIETRH